MTRLCVPLVTCFGLTLCSSTTSVGASVDVIPTNGLIGFWSGNGNAVDGSAQANNGSFGGSYVNGRPGGDKAFDLGSGKVSAPNVAAYNFTASPQWTVAFWFNTNGISLNGGATNMTFLGQDNGSGFKPKWFIDYGYSVYGLAPKFMWHVNDFNQERIFLGSDNIALPTGWNQLTVVVTASNVLFYLNGQLIGSPSLSGTYVCNPSANLIFGQAESPFRFDGLMNDVALYNRALSAQEVTAFMTGTNCYAAWAAAKGLVGANADFNADPDHDGITNGLEFVLGSEPNPANPNAWDLSPIPSATAGSDALVFTFSRTIASACLNRKIQFTTNPVLPWTTVIDGVNAAVQVTTNGPNEIVTATIPANGSNTMFARLLVSP